MDRDTLIGLLEIVIFIVLCIAATVLAIIIWNSDLPLWLKWFLTN